MRILSEAVKTKQELIHEKGFNVVDYGKIKVGTGGTLDGAVLDLGFLEKD